MRTLVTCLLVCLLPLALFSQTEKSATPLPTQNSKPKTQNSTRAVVVGISDYQDPGIPDLRFAHRDAEAFANWLRSPAGGSLDGDHLKVLLNSEATMAQFAAALDWLLEETQEGDKVLIYFSGHGDVEKKTITQPGFLLCWDARARVYMGSGVFALSMFQEVISTLSIQNKAKVIVIADACRSGTLAGQSVGGAQATAAYLVKGHINEIKILSCQPSEYSIEGEQWGGGRGAFSYHLVNALYGLADGNNDLTVTLQEAGRYLEDHVTAEVAPMSQMPMIWGNPTERLATVSPELLADLRAGRTSQMQMLSPADIRGLEDDVLAGVDTTVRELYQLFKKALKEKVFLEPAGACADAYYRRLMAEPKIARLHSTMTRNYAAYLQDDAQQALNTVIKGAFTKSTLYGTPYSILYRAYPNHLARAAELIGSKNYMYKHIVARKYYFEGMLEKDNALARNTLQKALEWQPDLAPAYLELIGRCSKELADSAIYYSEKAKDLIPSWVLPYVFLARFFSRKTGEYDRAIQQLVQAVQVDSNSAQIWYEWSYVCAYMSKWDSCEYYLLKAISSLNRDACFPCLHSQLGYVYLELGRYREAEEPFVTAIALDSTLADAIGGLAQVYLNTDREKEAVALLDRTIFLYGEMLKSDSTEFIVWAAIASAYFQKREYEKSEAALLRAISINPDAYFIRRDLAYQYLNIMQQYESAIVQLKEMIRLQPNNWEGFRGLAVVYCLKGNHKEAIIYVEQAIGKGSTFEQLEKDEDLAPLRALPEWQALMKKHFPDQPKD